MHILIFLYGLLIGSFLNVCIYRLPREESVVFPSSHCPKCGENLRWYDNIPLFSYLALRGRCRYCRVTISSQYPLIELLNGLLYLFIYFYYGFSLEFIFYALVFSTLICIALIDLKEMIIPDILVLILFSLAIVYKLLNYILYGVALNILDSLLGLLVGGGIFLLILILSKGGMGDGDITLMAALGFILGFRLVFLNILLAFILGAFISLFLLGFKIKSKKDPIPFGPFLIISFTISLFYGDKIINWYIQNFLTF